MTKPSNHIQLYIWHHAKPTLFITTLWQIWKDRNKKSFDNIDFVVSISAKLIYSYACEIEETTTPPSPSHPWTHFSMLYLVTPCTSSIKLNTDGCWYESKGKGGFGGLFRYSRGYWILGFFGKLLCDSSLKAELWGIYRGLTIILEKSLVSVSIESDSSLL